MDWLDRGAALRKLHLLVCRFMAMHIATLERALALLQHLNVHKRCHCDGWYRMSNSWDRARFGYAITHWILLNAHAYKTQEFG